MKIKTILKITRKVFYDLLIFIGMFVFLIAIAEFLKFILGINAIYVYLSMAVLYIVTKRIWQCHKENSKE